MARGNPGDMIGLKGKMVRDIIRIGYGGNLMEIIRTWKGAPSGAWRNSGGIQREMIGRAPGACSPVSSGGFAGNERSTHILWDSTGNGRGTFWKMKKI